VNLEDAISPDLEAHRRTSAELQPLNVKAFGIVMDKVARHVSNASGMSAGVNVNRLINAPDSSFRAVFKDVLEKHDQKRVDNEQSTWTQLKDVADKFNGVLTTLEKMAEPFGNANGVFIKTPVPVDGWASSDKPEITGTIIQHCSNLSADTIEFVRTRQENVDLKLELEAVQATCTRLRKEREEAFDKIDEIRDEMKEAEELRDKAYKEQLSGLVAQVAEKQLKLDRYTEAMIKKSFDLDARKEVAFVDEPSAKRLKGLDNIDTDDSSKEPTPIAKTVRLSIKEKNDLKAATAKELADTMATAGRQEDELGSPPNADPKLPVGKNKAEAKKKAALAAKTKAKAGK
jgi:hypothetical protein